MESTSTRRRRLDKDVSIDEMLRLRDQGLCNRDIAKSLEISYATVLKYIGKQGRRMECIAALADAPASKAAQRNHGPELGMIGEIFASPDGYAVALDYYKGTATLTGGSGELTIPLDGLQDFARFTISVAYKKGGCK